MTEKDINKCLKNGISEIAPDCLDDIMEKIAGREDISNPVKTTKRWSKKISYLVSMAASLVVLTGYYGFHQYDLHKITTVVELDVNPSIEFCADKLDRVVEVKGLNGDGEKIIENLSLEKENIKEATLTVMDELVENGFITKEKSTVLVSVENKNQNKTEEIKESLSKGIIEHLEKEDIKITVLKQTITKDEISESIAKEYNISKGKALLVKTIVEENSNLKEEELAQMTVDEIKCQANIGNSGEKSTEVSKDSREAEPTKTSEANRKEEPTKTPESNKKIEPTRPPEANKKEEPTKAPEGNKKTEPTKAPEGNKKTEPTKTPEGNKKTEPTKAPEGNKKTEPTKAPEGNKKTEPTKTPEGNKKAEPTRPPEGDKKAEPTRPPEGDKKARPTKAPEDDKKARPTGVPDAGEIPERNPDYPKGEDGRYPDKGRK